MIIDFFVVDMRIKNTIAGAVIFIVAVSATILLIKQTILSTITVIVSTPTAFCTIEFILFMNSWGHISTCKKARIIVVSLVVSVSHATLNIITFNKFIEGRFYFAAEYFEICVVFGIMSGIFLAMGILRRPDPDANINAAVEVAIGGGGM